MKTNLQLDFLVDKANKTITINREFAADLDLVWAAWTEPELLDQWWAPKPWKTETMKMDFKEGGSWIYAMIGPEGDKHFGRADYLSINLKQAFTAIDGFCDAEGIIDNTLPRNKWKNQFDQLKDTTLVKVFLSFDSLSDLEKIIEMGFKEGFLAALENLDELLQKNK